MTFTLCKTPGRLLHVFESCFERSSRVSVIRQPLVIFDRRLRNVVLFNSHLRTFSGQGTVRGIESDNSTISTKKFTPSAEQQAIVELSRTQNVVVSARPGAGKTATAEAIVAADPNKPIVVMTYSKRLQLGTARRLAAYPRSDVFTFHALAGQLFSAEVRNDSILRSLRTKGNIPAWTGELYELVILDELQDCTDDLFWLICAFVSALTHAAGGKAPQIVVLGDERQAIYEFRGADARYLSLSSSAMKELSPYQWTHLELSSSFRLSHENSAFVNDVFLGGTPYISGTHNGPKPVYLYGDVFDAESVSQHLVPLIQEYGPGSTAILTPSVRNNPHLPPLTNYLSEEHRIPIAVSVSDDIPLDDKVLRGKVSVTTYHQFKGNERDLVVVYGVDAGYFNFIGRDLPDDTCPNTIFVALTRACQQLVVVHDDRNHAMPFIDVEKLHETADVIHIQGDMKILEAGTPGRALQLGLLVPRTTFPSDMSRHIIDEEISNICTRNIKINQVQPPLPVEEHINAPETVLTHPVKKHYEAVSDLNGLAVVAAFELALIGTLTTLGPSEKRWLKDLYSTDSRAQAVWLCREACKYESQVSGYKSRYLQMQKQPFDWLGSYLGAARKRLEAQFPTPAALKFEVRLKANDFRVSNPMGGGDQTTKIKGRADIIQHGDGSNPASTSGRRKKRKPNAGANDLDRISIWEIKFVSQLSLQHAIQVCTYAYLWSIKTKHETLPRIILFNVRDGEKWEIEPLDGVASLRNVVEETLIAKYTTKDTLTMDEFLKKCAVAEEEVKKSYSTHVKSGIQDSDD